LHLPEIIPLALLLLILSMGGILSSGFEKLKARVPDIIAAATRATRPIVV
jgi:ABC-type polysaccharide transport system permease subunit